MNVSLEALHKIPVKVLQQFRKSGKTAAIPEYLQTYIKQLDRVVQIYDGDKIHNITEISKKLMETYPDISLSTAKHRVYDAINYFHLNSTVKEEAWNNYYADRYEDMARLAASKDNFQEARKFMENALNCRVQAAKIAINPEDFKPHIFLIDPRITPEMLGIENQNLKQIWNKSEELIDKMPLNAQEKDKLKREAAENLGVEDVDFEELDSHE